MTKHVLLLIVLIIVAPPVYATIVSGSVTDATNHPLAYANVYIKGTSNGVSTNADGKYFLQLLPGQYQLVFSYVGYLQVVKDVTLENESIVLNVQLQPETQQLAEVTITAGEDPAYAVIRAAIKKRKYFLDQIRVYSCKVYIKGAVRLDSLPKKIMGFNLEKQGVDSSMLGIVYLSESQSEYYFQKPDQVKEIMISSKVSGDPNTFSWNKASDFDFNFYKNLVDAGDSRKFISPISETALLYYKYHLVGTFYENGEMINKIKVIPRRKGDPAFSGYIYIVEDSWRIHSVNLLLTRDSKLDLLDSLRILQSFAKVNDTCWMPFSQTFLFHLKFFGVKASGKFAGVFSNYEIDPSFPKNFFNAEVWKINKDANKKDSLYWLENRPVPLTDEEAKHYEKKDSITRREGSKTYLDSIDRKRNKFQVNDLFSGYSYYKNASKISIRTSGLLQCINYNTVQGWAPQLSLELEKEYADKRRWSAAGDMTYGISNHHFNGKLSLDYFSNPWHQTKWSLQGGYYPFQFNEENPITPLINMLYTLFGEKNFMKLYENTFVKGIFTSEVVNGIVLNAFVSYNVRSPLENTTDFTFNHHTESTFTSNYPFAQGEITNFTRYQSLIAGVKATFRFKQKYYTRGDEKIDIGSKYPVLKISYTKGINALGSDVNFDQLEAEISDHMQFGLLGTSLYSVSAGIFLNNKSVGDVEKKHFNGNQTILAPPDHLQAYQLLPYYTYSTDQSYLEAHYEHHFEGFFLSKIPLIKKLKWEEVVGFHYLLTPQISYAELSLGLEHIGFGKFKIFRVDYVTSYSNALKLQSGFLFGIAKGIGF